MNTYPSLDSQKAGPNNFGDVPLTNDRHLSGRAALHQSAVIEAINHGEKVQMADGLDKVLKANGYTPNPDFIDAPSEQRRHRREEQRSAGGYALSKDGRLQLAEGVKLAEGVQVNEQLIVPPSEEHHYVHHVYHARHKAEEPSHSMAFSREQKEIKVDAPASINVVTDSKTKPAETAAVKAVEIASKDNHQEGPVVAKAEEKVASQPVVHDDVPVIPGKAEVKHYEPNSTITRALYRPDEIEKTKLSNNVAAIDEVVGPAHAPKTVVASATPEEETLGGRVASVVKEFSNTAVALGDVAHDKLLGRDNSAMEHKMASIESNKKDILAQGDHAATKEAALKQSLREANADMADNGKDWMKADVAAFAEGTVDNVNKMAKEMRDNAAANLKRRDEATPSQEEHHAEGPRQG